MPLRRVPVSWTTGIGGTGVSIFYCLEASDITVELATFFNAIKAFFPTVVTWNVPSSGDVIEITDGEIVGGWSGGTSANIAGGGVTAYVAGTGAYVRWNTSTIRDGRRLKGRTFLAPLLTNQFDTGGTITDATVTSMQAAASTLAGSGKLTIWGRPRSSSANDGQAGTVISGIVPDRVTSIHTRRS